MTNFATSPLRGTTIRSLSATLFVAGGRAARRSSGSRAAPLTTATRVRRPQVVASATRCARCRACRLKHLPPPTPVLQDAGPSTGGSLGARGGLRGTQSQGTIAPIPIAIPEFLGDDPQMGVEISNIVAGRSRALGSVPAAQPLVVSRADSRHQRRAAFSRLAPSRRRCARRRSRRQGARWTLDRRIPPLGSGNGQADVRPAIRSQRPELAPRRPSYRRSDLRAPDRRKRLLRHARRLHRRDRHQGKAHQAPGHHGSGRRQRAPA